MFPTMKGTIVNFRGKSRKNFSQIIVKVEGSENKESASKLLDKEVTWKTPTGKEIKGKVSGVHGNSGAVRVKFERGLPGQSLGTNVEVA